MKRAMCAIALSIVLLAMGCGALYDDIYDDDQKIASDANSYNKVRYKQVSINDDTTITCEKMGGMDTIWEYDADADVDLQMHHTFEVTQGRAKLVLIRPDDTICVLAEQEGPSGESSPVGGTEGDDPAEESVSILELGQGTNRIKIVCEKDTSFSLSFTIPKE